MPLKDREARRAYHKEYIRKRYQTDPDYRSKHQERSNNWKVKAKEKNRALVEEFRKDGCTLCSESEPCALVAYHLDPSSKEGNLADLASQYGAKRFRDELSKCVCVCKNCHSKIHAGVLSIDAG